MEPPDAKKLRALEPDNAKLKKLLAEQMLDNAMLRYQSRRSDDTDLRDAMRAVAKERRRFGYRRLHVMVERQGWQVNYKKFRRICREEKLQVRRRGGRKRALGQKARTSVGASISYLMR